MGKIEPVSGPMDIPLKFICPECEGNLLEEVMQGVTVFNTLDTIAYNEFGESIKWGDCDHEDGHIARFQCNACGYILEKSTGAFVRDYDDLIEWLKERDTSTPCESCEGLGFFASDRSDKKGLYLEIQRCDECEEKGDNWATMKAYNMAKGCMLLLKEAEFVLAMYEIGSEEALSSALDVQLREAIEKAQKLIEEADEKGQKLMEEADATSRD